jgi:hypothetical protein
MDVSTHLRTLWRYRVLLAVGLVVAAAVATLSFVRVGADGVSYRQAEQWQSSARLLATKRGYPFNPRQFDTTPFAILVSQYVTSDAVTEMLSRSGPIDGTVFANAEQLEDDYLPFISVSAVSATPGAAVNLAQRATEALREYVDERQEGMGIRENNRIVLESINEPGGAALVQGRKKTRPVMIFLALLSLTVGLAYVLENIRASRQKSLSVTEPHPVTGPRTEAPQPAGSPLHQEPATGSRESLTVSRRR